MFKKLIMVVLVLGLSACVSMMTFTAGTKIDRTHLEDIQIGVQDKAQILTWFGKPYTKGNIPEGHPYGCVDRLTFEYSERKGAKHIFEILVVDFDKNGKVCDKAFKESGPNK